MSHNVKKIFFVHFQFNIMQRTRPATSYHMLITSDVHTFFWHRKVFRIGTVPKFCTGKG